jgi:hypothetical protein
MTPSMATATIKCNLTPLQGWLHRQPSLFPVMTLARHNHLRELREANKELASASFACHLLCEKLS